MKIVDLEPSASGFAHLIVDKVRLGNGFVPFVGSGISAPSGILMGMEFTEYLAYTLYRVVDENQSKRWNLKQSGWPKSPSLGEIKATTDWFMRQYKALCKTYGLEVIEENGKVSRFETLGNFSLDWHDLSQLSMTIGRPLIPSILQGNKLWHADNQLRNLLRFWKAEETPFASSEYSSTSYEQVVEKSIRASCDWRATLRFLSQVSYTHGRLYIGESDTAVIDAFNAHITRDKQPCLGHKMLAHLTRSLRSRLVLTTNFDNLLEESYANIQHDVNVVSVSYRGNLPDLKTVRAKDCIIKLHGSLLDTRADFSLDELPSERDQLTFASYLGPLSKENTGEEILPNHLLVIGYSGADKRCIQFIKRSLELFPKQEAFWICYCQADAEKLEKLFIEDTFRLRIHAVVTARPDLLLYELYQRLNYSLPSGGFSYQFAAGVPPERQQHIDDDLNSRINSVIDKFELPGATNRDLYTVAEQVAAGLPAVRVGEIVRLVIVRKIVELVVNCLSEEPNCTKHATRYQDYIEITNQVPETFNDEEIQQNGGKIVIVRHRAGSIDAARKIVTRLESELRKKVIWVEQQDYSDFSSMLQDAFTNMAIRLGVFQLEHVNQSPLLNCDKITQIYDKFRNGSVELDKELKSEFKKLCNSLRRLTAHLGGNPSEWTIVIYGRNVPGACSAWGDVHYLWSEVQYKVQWVVLNCLALTGYQVLYFPFDSDRRADENRKAAHANTVLSELRKDYGAPTEPNDNEKSFAINFPLNEAETSVDGQFCRTAMDEQKKKWADGRKSRSSTYEAIIRRVSDDWIRPWCDDPVFPDSLQPQGRSEEALLRLHFLYATTLFRQSRHVSAFFIDGIYKCPFRFNFSGLDNDWFRATKVLEWIAELRESGVFYEKAGGFSWMHRDVRLGIQKICEGICLGEVYIRNRVTAGTKEAPPYDRHFFCNHRSGIHNSIGDWYLKAFLTNGHWVPAIESIYHYLMSARHAYLARPVIRGTKHNTPETIKTRRTASGPEFEQKIDDTDNDSEISIQSESEALDTISVISKEHLEAYRISSYKSALMELYKALTLSKEYIQYWMGTPNGIAMFSELDIRDSNEFHLKDSEGFQKILQDSLSNLKKSCSSADSDESLGAITYRCEQLVGQTGSALKNSKLVGERRFISWQDKTPLHVALAPTRVLAALPQVVSEESPKEVWSSFFEDRTANFVNEICDVASAISSIDDLKNYDRSALETLVGKKRSEWAASKTGDPAAVLQVLEGIGEYAYWCVKKTKRDYHERDAGLALEEMERQASHTTPTCFDKPCRRFRTPLRARFFEPPTHKEGAEPVSTINYSQDWNRVIGPVRSGWLKVSLLCNTGLSLCKHLDPVFLSNEIELRCKFNTLYGLALANLDRPFEAHRHLTEAIAYLSKSKSGLDPVKLAIIRLRRAEVYLTEALRLSDVYEELHIGCYSERDEVFLEGESEQILTSGTTPRSFFNEALIGNRIFKVGFLKARGQVSSFAPEERKLEYASLPPRVLEIFRLLGDRTNCGTLREQLLLAELSALDDAAATVDIAERNLSGKSQHSLWWGRIYALRLRLYAAEADLNRRAGNRFRSLIRRKPVQHDATHFEIYSRGVLSTANSDFRKLRIIEYFLDCVLADTSNQRAQELRSEIKSIRRDFDELDVARLQNIAGSYQELTKRKLSHVHNLLNEGKF